MSISSREYIILKAKEVISEKGVDGASLRDIAKRADMSTGAIYHYFKNKEELLYEIMDTGLSASVKIASDENLAVKSKEEVIDDVINNIVDRFNKDSENKIQFYLMKEAVSGDEYLNENYIKKYDQWTSQVVKLLRFLYDVEDNDKTRAVAKMLLGCIDGLVLRSLLSDSEVDPKIIGSAFKKFLTNLDVLF